RPSVSGRRSSIRRSEVDEHPFHRRPRPPRNERCAPRVFPESLTKRAPPCGVAFEENTDEYEAEVGTILPRLRSCASADDVQRVVHEEFCRWFGADQAGSLEKDRRRHLGRDPRYAMVTRPDVL